jgi:hypothetical protein
MGGQQTREQRHIDVQNILCKRYEGTASGADRADRGVVEDPDARDVVSHAREQLLRR